MLLSLKPGSLAYLWTRRVNQVKHRGVLYRAIAKIDPLGCSPSCDQPEGFEWLAISITGTTVLASNVTQSCAPTHDPRKQIVAIIPLRHDCGPVFLKLLVIAQPSSINNQGPEDLWVSNLFLCTLLFFCSGSLTWVSECLCRAPPVVHPFLQVTPMTSPASHLFSDLRADIRRKKIHTIKAARFV